MWQMVSGWEVRDFELVEEHGIKNPSEALATYIKDLEYQAAGKELWSLFPPRYNKTESLAFPEGR